MIPLSFFVEDDVLHMTVVIVHDVVTQLTEREADSPLLGLKHGQFRGSGGNAPNGDAVVGSDGLELLPLLRGYSYAVIVDAIQTWNYDPGTILIFDVADFESTVHDVPSHDINVATAIKIGREMDPDTMPLQIKFVAMEIKDMATMSEELTPEVAERQESAERAVLHVLSEFRKDRDQISSD